MNTIMVKEFNTKNMKKLINIFSNWESENLKITIGKRESNVENTYWLPYTSSGDYAGLWNTNTMAVLKSDESLNFDGIGFSTDLKPFAFFTKLDESGNEVKNIFLPIE